MITLKISKINLLIIIVCVLSCIINKRCLGFTEGIVNWFLSCYYNDIVGAIAFSAYCDIISSNSMVQKYKINKLWKLEIILLICGLFWEYITPIIRTDTVSDIFDILAYLSGGIVFWLVKSIHLKIKRKEEII